MQEDGFEGLCREQYGRLVRTALLITGDREEALDLAQEALARAFASWPRVSALERPDAWLQRVVTNLSISTLRRRSVRRRLRLVRAPEPVPPPEVEDPELAQALLALTPAQRAAVVLRYCADLSIQDTAAALGKRPGTVRALASQALKRLRQRLDRREVPDDISIP